MLVVPQSERLGKLIRLLASDQSGEVLAAVAAIRRITDFHTLADIIASHFSVDSTARVRAAAPGARAPTPSPATSTFWWRDMAAALLHHNPSLVYGGREVQFLQNMMRSNREPTLGQRKWLKDIADRARTKQEAA